MSKKQLPKSHPTHLNPKTALKNLERMFPEHWKIASLTDVFSNFEYGQDWIIQLTNAENELSSAEFRVQSKVTTRKTGQEFIDMKLKVSTINYLAGLGLPVMLHYYDKNDKCGYFMWLEDWYAINYTATLEREKKTSVRIPKANKLSKKSIEQIRSHVNHFHRKANLQKQIDAANRTSPYYSFHTEFGPKSFQVSMHIKTPEAPLPVTYMELDEANQALLQNAIETGETVTLVPRSVVQNLPDVMLSLAPSDMEIVEVIVVPNAPDRSFPAQVIGFDEEGCEIFRISYILMRLTKPGTQVELWEGISESRHITLTVVVDHRTSLRNYDIRVHCSPDDVTTLCNHFRDLDTVERIRRISIVNLDLDKLFADDKVESSPNAEKSEHEQYQRRLIAALTTLESKLNLKFALPPSVNFNQVFDAEFIAAILVDGFGPFPKHLKLTFPTNGQFNSVGIVWNTKLIVDHLIRGQVLDLRFLGDNYVTELLGHTIDLGHFDFLVHDMKIENLNELQATLENRADDEMVETSFTFDPDNLFLYFDHWVPKPDSIEPL